MSLQSPIVLVFSFVCLAVPTGANFQAGLDAANREGYATALSQWRPLAEKGAPSAQCYLGVLYEKGRG